jgi:type II secretory pathway pseudopilin PulG
MKTKRAFAVLELILVVAMIALVASVVRPVLDSLGLKSDRAHATHNFAELARGMSDYANDHNFALPAAGENRPTWQSSQLPASTEAWYNAIPRHLGHRALADFAGQPSAFYDEKNLLFVPAADYPENRDERPLFAVSINAELWLGERSDQIVRLDQHLAHTVIFQESGVPGEKSPPHQRAVRYDGHSRSDAIHSRARYHGRILVSFGDARVELLDPKELVDSAGNGEPTADAPAVRSSSPEAFKKSRLDFDARFGDSGGRRR